MIKTENVIGALPLVADALGRKYGVKIHIGGDRAYTNGNEIYLPSLPLDADKNILNLARGYLDHEAAHIRITDFEALDKANMDKLEKAVWNILEDYMVESKISEIYPGCKQNLEWLAKYIFLENSQDNIQNPAESIFNWLLQAVRTLSVQELANTRDNYAKVMDAHYPALRNELECIVMGVPYNCIDTKSCLQKAYEIMKVIRNYAKSESEKIKPKEDAKQKIGESKSSTENSKSQNNVNKEENSKQEDGRTSGTMQDEKRDKPALSDAHEQDSTMPEKTLEEYLAKPDNLPNFDMGQQAGELLQGESVTRSGLTVATPTPSSAKELSQSEISSVRTSTAALRTRLQALLQSKILTRASIGRVGRIDTGRIARLAVNNPKIFARTNTRSGINTAVHILLDTSGSMQGTKITLAANACYALASALSNVSGVSVAVTAFPGNYRLMEETGEIDWNTVSPLKTWRERLHSRFKVSCTGETSMAEALWWILQNMQMLKENRKIILILSDGAPQNIEEAQKAIQTHRNYGNEVYGIGIETNAMQRLVSEKYGRAIYDLKELAGAIFDMLGSTLIKPKGE